VMMIGSVVVAAVVVLLFRSTTFSFVSSVIVFSLYGTYPDFDLEGFANKHDMTISAKHTSSSRMIGCYGINALAYQN
jgi:hypothetical protein